MASRNKSDNTPHSLLTNYWGNGGGRDSYIGYDNGGNNMMFEPSRSPDRGTTYLA
jgi:hypothetical protein